MTSPDLKTGLYFIQFVIIASLRLKIQSYGHHNEEEAKTQRLWLSGVYFDTTQSETQMCGRTSPHCFSSLEITTFFLRDFYGLKITSLPQVFLLPNQPVVNPHILAEHVILWSWKTTNSTCLSDQSYFRGKNTFASKGLTVFLFQTGLPADRNATPWSPNTRAIYGNSTSILEFFRPTFYGKNKWNKYLWNIKWQRVSLKSLGRCSMVRVF